MNEFLYNYGLFFAEVATAVIAILIVVGGIIGITSKGKMKSKEKIEIINLNDKFTELKNAINDETLSKEALKEIKKQEKAKQKQEKITAKNLKKNSENSKISPTIKNRIFVLDFNGDIRASEVDNLREEITAILTSATPKDEVVVKIESGGGMVPNYGLAASQLQRIRERNIPLTACIDKIAASGGYMMACVANRILAAPFAILGSIGVVAQLPNFNKLLKKHDVDFELITAGEYKRTLTMFGENTDKGREKFQEEINEAHELFKNFVAQNRSIVNIEAIATGEHWFGTRAQELRLIDDITTSDDYLLRASEKSDIFEIKYSIKKSLLEKFSLGMRNMFGKIYSGI